MCWLDCTAILAAKILFKDDLVHHLRTEEKDILRKLNANELGTGAQIFNLHLGGGVGKSSVSLELVWTTQKVPGPGLQRKTLSQGLKRKEGRRGGEGENCLEQLNIQAS